MIATEFEKNLDYVTGHRATRQKIADAVLAHQAVFRTWFGFVFRLPTKTILKPVGFWNLCVTKNWDGWRYILDFFCSQIKNLKDESAIRPIAKICQLLINSHYKKEEIQLSEKHLEEITESNFDWLINDTKVASKAYSIRTLYLLGQHYDWIHPELKTIITKDFPNHSAAYKAVAKEVLKKIK